MQVKLKTDRFGNYLIVAKDGRDVFLSIWDYEDIATELGWEPDFELNADELLGSLKAHLNKRLGAIFEDPGYFPEPKYKFPLKP